MGKICGDREHWVGKYGWVHHVWLALNVLNECTWGLVLNFSIQSREECTRNNRESPQEILQPKADDCSS